MIGQHLEVLGGRTVYVVQNQHEADGLGGLRQKFDLSSARQFGELRFLLTKSASPFSPSHVIDELREKLRGYDARWDHVLLIGNPCLIGFTTALAAEADPTGRVSILQWHGIRREYISVTADLLNKSA